MYVFRSVAPQTPMLGASPVGLVSFDASGQCVVANEVASEIIGATYEQLLGQNYLLLDIMSASRIKKGLAPC